MGTSKITGLGTPTDNADATTKLYVDCILGSATAAAASAASTSATNAANSYDAFDDRYLGSKSSAPSVDNDGNALLTGALYWNSTSNELYLWTGSAWTSSALSGTDFVAKTGDTMTGALSLTALTASADSAFTSTGALSISKGTTGQRPTPASGMLRFNTTTTEFEGYNGTAWASVGGAALSNDTSTATNLFPLFANATSGAASTLFTGSTKLLYKPSTGELSSSVVNAGNGIYVNSQSIAVSYTIAAGYSGMSSGPVTIASGQSVTVSSGSRWVVV